MIGWVCLHRKFIKWEWYDDANTMRVFVHCLLRANHKDEKWRGISVKKGSFITSYQNLAKELKLTIKKVRTAIENLKSTGELAYHSTTKYSIITVIKWDDYQDKGKQDGSQGASRGQTKGKQRATDNNDNNTNNENKDDAYAFTGDFVRLNEGDYQRFRKLCPSLTDRDFKRELMKFDLAMVNEGQTKKDSKWFFRISSYLERAEDNQKQSARKETAVIFG